jgi:hypothetical protein
MYAQFGGGFGAYFVLIESADAHSLIGCPIYAEALGHLLDRSAITALYGLGERLPLLIIDVVDTEGAIRILRYPLGEAGVVMKSL